MFKNSKTIVINSANRTTGSNENFTYAYNKDMLESFTHVVLLQASIPLSYYLIQDSNNTFTLSENGSSVVITVSPGNYFRSSFLTHIKSLLNTNSPNGWTYDMTIPNESKEADTGKYTYSVSGNGGLQPSIIVSTNMYEQFGFDKNTTNTFSGDTLISTNCINFINKQTLLIHSNLVDTKSNNNKNILQEIYISNYLNYSCGVFQCPDVMAYSKSIINNNGNSISITLTNEDGTILNLNGRNCLYTIMLFNKHEVFDSVQSYLKYNTANSLGL